MEREFFFSSSKDATNVLREAWRLWGLAGSGEGGNSEGNTTGKEDVANVHALLYILSAVACSAERLREGVLLCPPAPSSA